MNISARDTNQLPPNRDLLPDIGKTKKRYIKGRQSIKITSLFNVNNKLDDDKQ